MGNVAFDVTKIDTIAPSCGTFDQTPTGVSQGPVTMRMTGASDAGGSALKADLNLSCEVSVNGGTCTVVLEDTAGNSQTCTSPVVTTIDQIKPVIAPIADSYVFADMAMVNAIPLRITEANGIKKLTVTADAGATLTAKTDASGLEGRVSEGQYRVAVDVEDEAGNRADVQTFQLFALKTEGGNLNLAYGHQLTTQEILDQVRLSINGQHYDFATAGVQAQLQTTPLPTAGSNNAVTIKLKNANGQEISVQVMVHFTSLADERTPTPRVQTVEVHTQAVDPRLSIEAGLQNLKAVTWQTTPSTVTLGSQTGTLKVMYEDDSEDILQVTVTVQDTQKPVITGTEDLSFEVGSSQAQGFVPQSGISVSDNYDQNLQLNCAVVPAYEAGQVGEYIVTCNVQDSSNNPAAPFTRTIRILSVDKQLLEQAIANAQARLNEDKVVNDQHKQALEALIQEAQTAKNNPNLTAQTRDALIARLDTAPLTKDTEKPVISGDRRKTMSVGSQEARDYDPVEAISVTDNIDQDLVPSCSTQPAYNAHQVGSYVVTCNARDRAGNDAEEFERKIEIIEVGRDDLQAAIDAAQARLQDEKVVDDTYKQALEALIQEAEIAKNDPNLTDDRKASLIVDLTNAVLIRDTQAPGCQLAPCIVADVTTPTNGNVTLTLTLDEPLKAVPVGWTHKPGTNSYTKVIEHNAQGEVEVEDRYGNKASFQWEVSNIDKKPPE